MANLTVNHVKLVGCSVTLGQNRHIIEDEPWNYDNDTDLLRRLKNTIGLGVRYTAHDGTTAADLCLDAAQRLLDALHCKPKDIGAIVSITQTPDYAMPGNAHVLHKRLGLAMEACAIDLNMGCSGFVYGLSVAAMLAEHGLDNVLLVAGDTLSRKVAPSDRTIVPLFGDAGSAALLRFHLDAAPMHFLMGSDGTGLDSLYSLPAPGTLYMNGYEIFRFTMTVQPDMLARLLAYAGLDLDDIDYYVFHQANRYIVRTISGKVGLDAERAPDDAFSRYGNLNSASIPAVLCGSLAHKLTDRDAKVVLQGFGIGLSWAGCQIILEHPYLLKPVCLGKDHE